MINERISGVNLIDCGTSLSKGIKKSKFNTNVSSHIEEYEARIKQKIQRNLLRKYSTNNNSKRVKFSKNFIFSILIFFVIKDHYNFEILFFIFMKLN